MLVEREAKAGEGVGKHKGCMDMSLDRRYQRSFIVAVYVMSDLRCAWNPWGAGVVVQQNRHTTATQLLEGGGALLLAVHTHLWSMIHHIDDHT